MSEHILPADGSVLIVDDKLSDVKPLIQMFSKEGIATTYYSGTDDDELPERPKQKVRLAFFDIQLQPAQSSHNYAQNILRLLEELIDENNGPFVLILWSGRLEQHALEVKEQVLSKKSKRKPLCVIQLEKQEFFVTEEVAENNIDDFIDNVNSTLETALDRKIRKIVMAAIKENYPQNFVESKELKDDAILKLRNKILEELNNNVSAFQFFNFWETAISKASGQVVRKFSEFHNGQEDWDQRVKYDLYHLAQAQTGNNNDDKIDKEIVKNSLKTLNQSFVDEVATQLNQCPDLSEVINISQSDLRHIEDHKIDGKEYKLAWKAENDLYSFETEEGTDIRPNTLENLHDKYLQYYEKADTKLNEQKLKKAPEDKLKNLEKDLLAKKNNYTALVNLIKKIEEIKININTNLHIDNIPPNYIQPGNVYEFKIASRRKKELLKTYFSHDQIEKLEKQEIEKVRFVELEVSPPCDLANNKSIKHRMLPGILLAKEVYDKFTRTKKAKKDCTYHSAPTFLLEGNKCNLLFDFRLFKSYDTETLDDMKPILRLKHELHADIISKLSSHISRLGISFIQ